MNITNALGLAHVYLAKDIRQHVPKGGRSINKKQDDDENDEIRLGYIDWYPGELNVESGHQWWFNKHAVYLLDVSKGADHALRQAYDTRTRIRDLRKRMYAIRGKKSQRTAVPRLKSANVEVPPPTTAEVIDRMRKVTDNWQWQRPHRKPRAWPGTEVWKQQFADLGFGVMLIAHGEELKRMQAKLDQQWLVGVKESIRNQRCVWIAEKGWKIPIWETAEEDSGRLMVWMDEENHLPGINIVRDHYPTSAEDSDAQAPVVTLEVILGNHPRAMAQQPHWDQYPTLRTDDYEIIEDTLGSAIIALYPTRVLIWVFSHRLTDQKYIPVEVMLPAGSALSFATMLHAGAGDSHIECAMVRQVPSLEDSMNTNPVHHSIRGQCHIARKHRKCDLHRESPVPDDQVNRELQSMTSISSYAYFDQTMDIPIVYPPVYLPQTSDWNADSIQLEYLVPQKHRLQDGLALKMNEPKF